MRGDVEEYEEVNEKAEGAELNSRSVGITFETLVSTFRLFTSAAGALHRVVDE